MAAFLYINGGVEVSKTVKDVMSKSKAAKKARRGDDMGKKGKNFDKLADKAGKEYGSKEEGERVAGAVFQKMRKRGKL